MSGSDSPTVTFPVGSVMEVVGSLARVNDSSHTLLLPPVIQHLLPNNASRYHHIYSTDGSHLVKGSLRDTLRAVSSAKRLNSMSVARTTNIECSLTPGGDTDRLMHEATAMEVTAATQQQSSILRLPTELRFQDLQASDPGIHPAIRRHLSSAKRALEESRAALQEPVSIFPRSTPSDESRW